MTKFGCKICFKEVFENFRFFLFGNVLVRQKALLDIISGADAINISGLLNPKMSGNFKN